MRWTEGLERASRAVLWLVIAGAVTVGIAEYVARAAAQTELVAELAATQEKLAKAAEVKDPRVTRLPSTVVGQALTGFSVDRGEGYVTFTNASAQTGQVCLRGAVTSSVGASESLDGCSFVEPFTTVTMTLRFARRDMERVCGSKSECEFSMKDASAQ
jgi:hypothetical protein